MRASRMSWRSVAALKELKRKSTAAMGGGDRRKKIRLITKLCRYIFGENLPDEVRVSYDKDQI